MWPTSQVLTFVALAFAVGALVGWFVREYFLEPPDTAAPPQPDVNQPPPTFAPPPPPSGHKYVEPFFKHSEPDDDVLPPRPGPAAFKVERTAPNAMKRTATPQPAAGKRSLPRSDTDESAFSGFGPFDDIDADSIIDPEFETPDPGEVARRGDHPPSSPPSPQPLMLGTGIEEWPSDTEDELGPEPPDDLTRLPGVGAAFARKLKEQGITRFAQIAAWTEADLDKLAEANVRIANRARKDGSISAAQQLVKPPSA